jgi:hypothetical protein
MTLLNTYTYFQLVSENCSQWCSGIVSLQVCLDLRDDWPDVRGKSMLTHPSPHPTCEIVGYHGKWNMDIPLRVMDSRLGLIPPFPQPTLADSTTGRQMLMKVMNIQMSQMSLQSIQTL